MAGSATSRVVRRAARSLGAVVPVVAAISGLTAIAVHRHLRFATADGLLPALISTQRLTPFYWGQDRLASLVPALAWPIRDVMRNLRFQTVVLSFGFFALLAMFATFHLRSRVESGAGSHGGGGTGAASRPLVAAIATGLAGLAALFVLTPLAGLEFVLTQPHALSTALFLAGGHVAVNRHGWRAALGAPPLLAASLLNPSVVLMAPAFWALDEREQPTDRWRRLVVAGALAAGAFTVSMGASLVLYDGVRYTSSYGDFSLGGTLDGLEPSVRWLRASVKAGRAVPVTAVALAAVAARWSRFGRPLRRAHVVAPLLAAGWFLLFAGNRWVEMNLHMFRYFFPLYAAWLLVVVSAATEAVVAAHGAVLRHGPAWLRRAATPRRLVSGAVAAVAAAALAVVLVVVLARTPIDVVEAARDDAAVVERLGSRLVVGDYWQVWPVVLTARSQGVEALGVAGRSVAIATEIVDALQLDGAARTVRLTCLGVGPEECVAYLAPYSPQRWTVVATVHDDPLVVDASPAVP